jgi:ATP-binding cassette subfamily C protein LapB
MFEELQAASGRNGSHMREPSVTLPATAQASTAEEAGVIRGILADLFANRKRLLVQLALAAALSNLFVLALPMFSMSVYDRVVPHLALETLWALAVGVAILIGADALVRHLRLKLLDATMLALAVPLQAQLYSRIIRARLGLTPVSTGALAIALRDIEALCHAIPALIVSLAVDLPWFIGVSILLYAVGGATALVPVVGAAVLAAIHLLAALRRTTALRAATLTARQTNLANEAIAVVETAKIAVAEPALERRWHALADEAGYAGHLNRLTHGVTAQASAVVGQVLIAATLVVGVYEIGRGAISLGGLTAAMLLVGRMMPPVSQLMALAQRVWELCQSARGVDRFLGAPQEHAGDGSGMRRQPVRGLIEMRDVSFVYPQETAPSLSRITLRIAPEERVGIIGRIGSGKSTLLRLILRLYEPSEGTIGLDGYDLRQFDPRAIRQAFGFMRQDSVLFDDTLHNNICYGLGEVDPHHYERAVALSGVEAFASRHPSGFSMPVGPRGERLSGGERQSVALARVIAADPRLLLLDEPTAAMDNALEASIVRQLKAFCAGRTLIVATHRAPLLDLVDRIVWLDGGRIVADGPKDEVLASLRAAA